MNRPLDRKELERLQAEVPVTMTRDQLIDLCIAAMQPWVDHPFSIIYDIEGLAREGKLAAMSATGTIFEPMIEHINAQGVHVEETLGSFQSRVGLSTDEMHDLACWCKHEASHMTGAEAAERLKLLQAGILCSHRTSRLPVGNRRSYPYFPVV
jgi:hypothetical protein